jgi:hypothetical protein
MHPTRLDLSESNPCPVDLVEQCAFSTSSPPSHSHHQIVQPAQTFLLWITGIEFFGLMVNYWVIRFTYRNINTISIKLKMLNCDYGIERSTLCCHLFHRRQSNMSRLLIQRMVGVLSVIKERQVDVMFRIIVVTLM